MRGIVILGLLALILGCEKKAEPTNTPPSGWSPPAETAKPTGSSVEPGK